MFACIKHVRQNVTNTKWKCIVSKIFYLKLQVSIIIIIWKQPVVTTIWLVLENLGCGWPSCTAQLASKYGKLAEIFVIRRNAPIVKLGFIDRARQLEVVDKATSSGET